MNLKRKFFFCFAALSMGTTLAAPTFASPIGSMTWNSTSGMFSVTSAGDLGGQTYSFHDNAGHSFTAESECGMDAGSCNGAAPVDLYAKNGGTGETGLGLAGTTNNEIAWPNVIELDVGSNTQVSSVTIGSIQAGETWGVWGGNGDNFQFLGGGTGGGVVTFGGLSSYQDLLVGNNNNGANSGNVVLEGVALQGVAVPEPATLGLMGFALVGAGLAKRKQKKR